MNLNKLFPCLVILILSAAPTAHARLGVVATVNKNLPTSGQSLGGGLYYSKRMSHVWGFQSALTLERQRLNDNSNQAAHFVFGPEYHLNHTFAINVGGYFDYLISPNKDALNTSVFGVEAGVSLYVPLGQKIDLVIAPRYDYALTNVSATGSLNPHLVRAYVGFVFGMEKEDKSSGSGKK